MLATRGLAILIAVFSLPAYLHFFPDVSALGVWFTLLSVMGWLLTFDFGVGNGLRNRVAEGIALGQDDDLRGLISSTYVVSTLVALAMGVVCAAAVWIVNWNHAFNVSETALSPEALRLGLSVATAAVLLQLILRNSQALLYAVQRPALASSLALYTSCAMLAAILIMPSSSAEQNFISLTFVYLFASVFPLIVVSVWLFTSSPLAGMRPRWRLASRHGARRIAGLGLAFFAMNLCYMAIVTTDTVIIAAWSGPADVVDYQVYFRPFGLISSLFIIAMSPMWSAITSAWAIKDYPWISTVIRRMFLAGVGASVLVCAMVPLLQPLVDIWLGSKSIDVDVGYAMSFAGLAMAAMWNAILSNVASGMGETKIQLTTYACGAFAKVPLSIWLCGALGSWIGVVVATAIALSFYAFVQTLWLLGRLSGATNHGPNGGANSHLVATTLNDREA